MSKVRKGLIQEAEKESAWNEWKQRTAGKRPKGRYYLIVCEGTKTEPNYFESIRKRLSGGQGDKIVVVGAQDNTLGLVERAREEIVKRNQSDNPPYYHVWLVFDKDSFPDDDFDNAIAMAEQEDRRFGMKDDVLLPHWHAAWSNEAFELRRCPEITFTLSDRGIHQRNSNNACGAQHGDWEKPRRHGDHFGVLLCTYEWQDLSIS